MGVGCPCPPVRNDIVTPRHLCLCIFGSQRKKSVCNSTPESTKTQEIKKEEEKKSKNDFPFIETETKTKTSVSFQEQEGRGRDHKIYAYGGKMLGIQRYLVLFFELETMNHKHTKL